MGEVQYFKYDFSPDEFEGTADYYSRYRIPYPNVLFEDLIKRVSPSPQSTLLDLATGPGRAAIPLASFFTKVLANDLDSDMIEVGKRDAEKKNVNNIEWIVGRAEELTIEPNSIDLITIGEAFHRLDQFVITDLAFRWLKPGAHIVIMGLNGIWQGKVPWHKVVDEIVNKWTPGGFNAEYQDYIAILKDKGFIDCETHLFEVPHYSTVDSIIGFLYSTSRCKKKSLGDNTAGFEAELKSELLKFDKSGRFFETLKCGYDIGKKPVS